MIPKPSLLLGLSSLLTLTLSLNLLPSTLRAEGQTIPQAEAQADSKVTSPSAPKEWNWEQTPKIEDCADFPSAKSPWNAGKDDERREKLLKRIAELRKLPAEDIKAFPAAADFPGIPADGTPIVTETILLDPKIGHWHSTGLYALPGVPLTISFPKDTPLTVKNEKSKDTPRFSVILGCHKDKLNATKHTTWKRLPEISYNQPISATETKVATPMGGLVYINVHEISPDGEPIKVTISGAVKSPRYILGKTTPEDWKKQLETTVPWGEIETPRLITSLSLEQLKQIPDIQAIAECLQKGMKLQDWLAGWDKTPHKLNAPMRLVVDRQISAGAGHSGYPAMGHVGWGAPLATGSLLTKGSWGIWHELGHNHQNAPFRLDGMGEVTVNLFSLLCQNKACGIPFGESWGGLRNAHKQVGEFISSNESYQDMQKNHGLKLYFFVPIMEDFGFEPFRETALAYHKNPYPASKTSNPEKWDFLMTELSRATKHNMGPYFKLWKTPVTDAAIDKLNDLPLWTPKNFPVKLTVKDEPTP